MIAEIKLAGLAIAGQLLQVMQQLPCKGEACLQKSYDTFRRGRYMMDQLRGKSSISIFLLG